MENIDRCFAIILIRTGTSVDTTTPWEDSSFRTDERGDDFVEVDVVPRPSPSVFCSLSYRPFLNREKHNYKFYGPHNRPVSPDTRGHHYRQGVCSENWVHHRYENSGRIKGVTRDGRFRPFYFRTRL